MPSPEELVSSIDIAQSVLDLAAATIGGHIHGASFPPLLTHKTAPLAHRASVLIENYSYDCPFPWVPDGDYRAIKTNRHKLINWIQQPEFDELYDLKADACEERNVIKDPSNHGLVERLHSELGSYRGPSPESKIL
jgi:arylsulfatase A-like enzyme